MPGYAVVQFTEWKDGRSVEAVPCSWVVQIGQRQMCYYPKTGSKKAIQTCQPPRGDWDLHAIRKLTRTDILSFKKALKKESKSLKTSNVESDG